MSEAGRPIAHTPEVTRHPWPEEISLIQGGARGLVLRRDGDDYQTAFVEVFPPGTFIRGEGKTIADAEDVAWGAYQRLAACPAHPDHGPFERRQYRNGAGFCTQCGAWFSQVLPELPEDPAREPGPLEQLLRAVAGADDTKAPGRVSDT